MRLIRLNIENDVAIWLCVCKSRFTALPKEIREIRLLVASHLHRERRGIKSVGKQRSSLLQGPGVSTPSCARRVPPRKGKSQLKDRASPISFFENRADLFRPRRSTWLMRENRIRQTLLQ